MSDERETKRRDEKDEKDEKDEGRDNEKWGEKWGGEKWSSDPLGSALWALFIIWIGVVLLMANMGDEGEKVLGLDWDNFWAWVLTGGGVLTWLDILLRMVMPTYRRPLGGRIIWGTILLVLGVGGLIDMELWPLIIIAIGVSMLAGYFRPRGD